MSNKVYKVFACPIYDESLPVITTDNKDAIRVIEQQLMIRDCKDDYEIRDRPSSNVIQVCNIHKELKINWLNLSSQQVEQDVYTFEHTVKLNSILRVLDSFIGSRFVFEEFKNIITNHIYLDYAITFCECYIDYFIQETITSHLESCFNKSNHLLMSTKVTTISNRLSLVYKYEA
jgi:hypothetical protein